MTDSSAGREPAPTGAAIRIGDTERNAAVAALGEHLTTGRLDLDEYGTRSAVANNARTVGDLQELFADLPAPHPPLPSVAGPVQLAGTPRPGSMVGSTEAYSPAIQDDRSKAQKLVAAAAAASSIIAVVLFFATDTWWWFLLIPLISTIAGSIWGDSWKRPDRR